jgi:energy-coupling factor transport system ATP-binding protein
LSHIGAKSVNSQFAVIDVESLSYRYSAAGTEALRGISFAVSYGECVCLSGPSGCGKSTLLLAIADLLKGGELTGGRVISHLDGRSSIGIVFQNAESQILATTVRDEVAFGPQNLSLPNEKVRERVRDALDAVGLSGYETRNVEELSAGEKHRLTIASVLSMQPSLLLLDEPTAQLDRAGKESLRSILKSLKDKGYTIIIADHDIEPYGDIADVYLLMRDGKIEGQTRHAPLRPCQPPALADGPARKWQMSEEMFIDLEKVDFSRPGGRQVAAGLSLKARHGERVHIWGENGAGKSTLFKLITGLLRPESGSVKVLGLSAPKPETLRGKVGLLLQNPVRQLFEETAYQEVSFSLRRQCLSPAEIEARTVDALSLCDALHLRDRSPLTLSYGEKHRVTLASMIALKPRIMLLDEPFSGLDFGFRYKMLDILGRCGTQYGCTILVASHDPMVDPSWADRSYRLKDGMLEEMSA